MPFFDIFASPRWSPLRMRTKVVSFFIFSKSFQTNRKIKALRPKMTKIASRGGSCLKHPWQLSKLQHKSPSTSVLDMRSAFPPQRTVRHSGCKNLVPPESPPLPPDSVGVLSTVTQRRIQQRRSIHPSLVQTRLFEKYADVLSERKIGEITAGEQSLDVAITLWSAVVDGHDEYLPASSDASLENTLDYPNKGGYVLVQQKDNCPARINHELYVTCRFGIRMLKQETGQSPLAEKPLHADTHSCIAWQRRARQTPFFEHAQTEVNCAMWKASCKFVSFLATDDGHSK